MVFEITVGMFGEPGGNGMCEPVFPDKGLTDDVGICEGGLRVGHEVVEVEGFVGGNL